VTIAAIRPDDIHHAVKVVAEGAALAGRDLALDYPVTSMVDVVVLENGEPVTSPRVLAMTDSRVAAAIHFAYEMWAINKDESVPPPFRPFWEEYCAHVDRMATPAARRHLELHEGHATSLAPVKRRFLTEDAIRAVTIGGQLTRSSSRSARRRAPASPSWPCRARWRPPDR
jgi:hypothetical protein